MTTLINNGFAYGGNALPYRTRTRVVTLVTKDGHTFYASKQITSGTNLWGDYTTERDGAPWSVIFAPGGPWINSFVRCTADEVRQIANGNAYKTVRGQRRPRYRRNPHDSRLQAI
jgi:hypothetical protein